MQVANYIRSIAESGLLKVLKRTELAVLMVHMMHSDRDGVSWPSSEVIGDLIGNSYGNHVRVARRSLAAHGLLEALPRRGYAAPYRLIFRPSKAAADVVPNLDGSESETRPSPETGHVPISDDIRPDSGRSVVPKSDTEVTQEVIQEATQGARDDRKSVRRRAKTAAAGVANTPEVEAIYRAYPRHVGRPGAIKAIVKAMASLAARGEPPAGSASWAAWLLTRTERFAADRAAEISAGTSEPKYTPYPATWFNGERYDDEAEPSAAKSVRRDAAAAPGGFVIVDPTPEEAERMIAEAYADVVT